MTIRTAPLPYMSFDDFVASEGENEGKREWLDGVVYAMAGGSIEHGRLAANWIAAMRARFGPVCKVLSSDVMLYVRETKLATYPDASVVCGPIDVHEVVRNGRVIGEAVTNPTLVLEVLSDSTSSYDRGEKFSHYMRMSSLEAYLLVSQDVRSVEVFHRPRERGHWHHDVAAAGGRILVRGETFVVDELYA